MTVYAVRGASGWVYFDAGPALRRYRVSFDSAGSAVVLGQTGYGAPNPVILRQSGFATFALGDAVCSTPGATTALSSEVVNTPMDPDLPWMFASGIAEFGGASFISAASSEGNYLASQQQLIYRCAATDPWTLVNIDSTNSAPRAQSVVDADGNLLAAYSWGRFSRVFTDGPQYVGSPPDYVYAGRHAGNYCGVTP